MKEDNNAADKAPSGEGAHQWWRPAGNSVRGYAGKAVDNEVLLAGLVDVPPGFRRFLSVLLYLHASGARIAGGAASHSSYHPEYTRDFAPGD